MPQTTITLNKKLKNVNIISGEEYQSQGESFQWNKFRKPNNDNISPETQNQDAESSKQGKDADTLDITIPGSEELMNIEEVKREIQKAYDQGFSDGQDTTTATFQAQIQQHQKWLKNLDSVIKELRSEYTHEIITFEKSLIELAILVAEKIIGREVARETDIIIGQVSKAIKSLDKDVVFKIRIHPENIDVLEQVKSKLFTDAEMMTKVSIVPDNSIDRGGCKLETSAGTVDATIKTQLEKISQKLNQVAVMPDEYGA